MVFCRLLPQSRNMHVYIRMFSMGMNKGWMDVFGSSTVLLFGIASSLASPGGRSVLICPNPDSWVSSPTMSLYVSTLLNRETVVGWDYLQSRKTATSDKGGNTFRGLCEDSGLRLTRHHPNIYWGFWCFVCLFLVSLCWTCSRNL